ncbi:MAG: BMC domain-containing protein, partial [Deltaproteobacteria bacterium]|nr:BMC domain-containing protein [Deltaproteobacteria bacterium]
IAATDIHDMGAVGVIETFSVATTIVAADAACKAAEIDLIEIRLGTGLGGKAFVTLTGELDMVEAAVAGGISAINSGFLLRSEVIPSPHRDLSKALL